MGEALTDRKEGYVKAALAVNTPLVWSAGPDELHGRLCRMLGCVRKAAHVVDPAAGGLRMPKVKSAGEIADKWARVVATRTQDYEAGVKDPNVDWARSTEAARENFEAGVSEAIQRGAFQRGVAAAGNQKWQANAAAKGTARWAPGVRAAQPAMEAGMATVVQVIERTVLPPRGPRGDPRNMERAAVMARALSEARKRS